MTSGEDGKENFIELNLKKMGISLPQVFQPAASYVSCMVCDNIIYVSGQISRDAEGKLITGRLGDNLSLDEGKKAAYWAALSALSQLKNELNGFDKVEKLVKMSGFVNSSQDFFDQPKVIDGASEVFNQIFGSGHSRSAIGCVSLPLGVAVEIETIFKIKKLGL